MDFKKYLLISESADSFQWGEIDPSIENELTIRYVRSSGSGGQKVNKTASKAVLSWPVKRSDIWKDNQEARDRFLSTHGNQISNKGLFRAECQERASQLANRKLCKGRLKNAIEEALKEPKKRLATAPTTRSIEKRIGEKKQKSQRKSERGQSFSGDNY
jgi:ribosome-associated protein